MQIRTEREEDRTGVRAVNESAFATPAEADLVDALRGQARPVVSLVADDQGAIVGHILFSPVLLTGHPDRKIMGLGPMAVLPEHQRKGVGSALVAAGLEACEKLGYGAVVVLGDPEFYRRFGFVPSTQFAIRCEYEAPEGAFMVKELRPGNLRGATGTIKYHAAFSNA